MIAKLIYDRILLSKAFDPRGDQAHFGPILGLFHRAWLLQLEISLRAVDSSIEALPYWDYAKDLPPLSRNYTSIFHEDYFGSYVGRSPDYAVINGKFAKWPIKKGHEKWKNPYGYMRHPLSPNKSPYLTRNGGSICGFTLGLGDPNMWNECLNVGEHISQWTACVDSNIHGRTHSSISGSWRREGQDHDSPFCAQWYGYIAPPTPSSLINQNTDPYYQYGTFISPYSMGCFDCPICDDSQGSDTCMCSPANKNSNCGPLWTNLVTGNDTITQGTFLRKGTVQHSTKNAATLSDLAGIQILGDIGDPAASPNDPL